MENEINSVWKNEDERKIQELSNGEIKMEKEYKPIPDAEELRYHGTSDKPDIKIFVSHRIDKDSYEIHELPFIPVRCGACFDERENTTSFGDDTGVNISERRNSFCELTVQYWAWKNIDADYYGLCHYRRYISFNSENYFERDGWGIVVEEAPIEKQLEKYSINFEAIERELSGFDVILPEIFDCSKFPVPSQSIREQYVLYPYEYEKDIDIVIDVIKEKYPDYYLTALNYFSGHKTYFCNIFIMKKEIFNQYCEWLFDILFECEKRIDISNYSIAAKRVFAYLSERLLNIFITKLKETNRKIRIKELQLIFFKNTTITPEYKPAFSEKNHAIVFAANDYYTPYLGTLLYSLKCHSSNKNNYDIFIMSKDMSSANKNKLENIFRNEKNFSIRFIDISIYAKDTNKFSVNGHFTVEVYFRLYIPYILSQYKKILYLDSDMIICEDIAKLYETDIDGFLLGVCHDPIAEGVIAIEEKNINNYTKKVLHLKSPYNYFNSGVTLFNSDEFRNAFSKEEVILVAQSNNWRFVDQDVLNILAQGKVKYLDLRWNVEINNREFVISNIISNAPATTFQEYLDARESPKIIHYAGDEKPWTNPSCDFAEVFWEYARKTQFYELILKRMAEEPVKKRDELFVKKNADEVLHNWSFFKIWSFVSLIPRKIARTLRCCSDHGFKHTFEEVNKVLFEKSYKSLGEK